jgi:hypothetical protein
MVAALVQGHSVEDGRAGRAWRPKDRAAVPGFATTGFRKAPIPPTPLSTSAACPLTASTFAVCRKTRSMARSRSIRLVHHFNDEVTAAALCRLAKDEAL